MNKIFIGDTIPSFVLKDQNGNDFDIYQRHADEALKICLLLKRNDTVVSPLNRPNLSRD